MPAVGPESPKFLPSVLPSVNSENSNLEEISSNNIPAIEGYTFELIKSDGWCFYNTILQALTGSYSQESSLALAKRVSKWLSENKNFVFDDSGETIEARYNTILGGQVITIFGDPTTSGKVLTFDEYTAITIETTPSGAPKVWPELVIAGHAIANLLNITLKTYKKFRGL